MARLASHTVLIQQRNGAGMRARYLAVSGLRYIESLSNAEFRELAEHGGTTLGMSGGDTVVLTVSNDDGDNDFDIASVGVVAPESPLEGRFMITGARSPAAGIGFAEGGIADFKEVDSFGTGAVGDGEGYAGAVDIDVDNEQANLGNGLAQSYGAVWYGGSATAGGCVDGACVFGEGIRASFDFQFAATGGDGFVFVLAGAEDNDCTRCGGDVDRGELLGYAGPGATDDGLGIIPPKIGVEFDIRNNTGVGNPEDLGACADGDKGNHMALVFWGRDEPDNQCSMAKPDLGSWSYDCTYDDVRHSYDGRVSAAHAEEWVADAEGDVCFSDIVGAHAGGEEPANSRSGATPEAGAYYERRNDANWLTTGARHVRIEAHRAATANGNGEFEYVVRVWVDCFDCADITSDYDGAAPVLEKAVALDGGLHAAFNRFYVGWTEASGRGGQDIVISNFALGFR